MSSKADYRDAVQRLQILQDLCREYEEMTASGPALREGVRSASGQVLLDRAVSSMKDISIEELKKSKAGIRVAVLRDAGYEDLADLIMASDEALRALDGIGEKQVRAIRSNLAQFAEHLSAKEPLTIHLPGMPEDAADGETVKAGNKGEHKDFAGLRRQHEDALLLALVKYRQMRLLLQDSDHLKKELQSFAQEMEYRVKIRSRLRWTFATRKTREATQEAAGEMKAFFESPLYLRAERLAAGYRAARDMTLPAAQDDFARNAAECYAILDELGTVRLEKKLLYSSIPEELAAHIDEFTPDLSAFRGTLRAYQLFGVKYILTQGRVLLGDEMGLGKTVEAIAAMAHLYAAGQYGSGAAQPSAGDSIRPRTKMHFLVVAPASVLYNWCREITRFSKMEAFLLHGPDRMAVLKTWKTRGGVAVTNYESMANLVWAIDRHMRLAMLVVDEAHYIKNPDAQRTKNIRRLNEEAEHMLFMTGTPLENKAEEMCTLISFLRPDMEKELRKAVQMSATESFREILSPVYLRRRTEDVLAELPPVEEMQEWCEMTPQDREAYFVYLAQRQFTPMRRVSFLQDDLTNSAKAQRLLELCENAENEGRKAVVFSFFRETVRKVSALLSERCKGVITGSTPALERQQIIDRFRDEPAGSVLAAQIQAGGTGLNIQSASMVIFCEPQIKPSLTRQAIARVHRMGQLRNVLVFHLLCRESIDEAVTQLLSDKQETFDAYADESEIAQSLDRLIDDRWIAEFLENESRRYLPAVISEKPV